MSTDKIKVANKKWKHEHKRKQVRDRKRQRALDEKLTYNRKLKNWKAGKGFVDEPKQVLTNLKAGRRIK